MELNLRSPIYIHGVSEDNFALTITCEVFSDARVINLLKPSGYFMYHQFNITKF